MSDTEEHRTPHSRRDDAGPRWDNIRVDQFGYTLNVLLALACAMLGCIVSLLRDKDFSPSCAARFETITSLALLSVSIVAAICCTLVRLADIRGTAQRANEKAEAPSQEFLTMLGNISWFILKVQSCTFALGGASLGLALLATYGHKLR